MTTDPITGQVEEPDRPDDRQIEREEREADRQTVIYGAKIAGICAILAALIGLAATWLPITFNESPTREALDSIYVRVEVLNDLIVKYTNRPGGLYRFDDIRLLNNSLDKLENGLDDKYVGAFLIKNGIEIKKLLSSISGVRLAIQKDEKIFKQSGKNLEAELTKVKDVILPEIESANYK